MNRNATWVLIFFLILTGTQVITNHPLQKQRSVINNFKVGNQSTAITVYAYESLLAWGTEGESLRDSVFSNFSQETGITVTTRLFSDAFGAMTQILLEKDNPVADVIIGIDNSMLLKILDKNILEPYIPSNIENISADLITALDPNHYLTPFDYGLIAPVYKLAANFQPYNITNLTFQDLSNSALLNRFITEDPTLSSTGLGFLLTQVAIYEKILNRSWTEWWSEVRSKIDIKPSWGDAYNIFLSETSGKDICVSYSTDPAYSVYFYGEPATIGVTFSSEGGHPNAWLQVEGIGLVKNAPNPQGAKQFIDYFLANSTQTLLPTNNWMFPANKQVKLPPAFQYAINASQVNILNLLYTQKELKTLLSTLLTDWEDLMAAITSIPSFEWPIMLLGCVVLISLTKREKKQSC